VSAIWENGVSQNIHLCFEAHCKSGLITGIESYLKQLWYTQSGSAK